MLSAPLVAKVRRVEGDVIPNELTTFTVKVVDTSIPSPSVSTIVIVEEPTCVVDGVYRRVKVWAAPVEAGYGVTRETVGTAVALLEVIESPTAHWSAVVESSVTVKLIVC